MATDGDRWSAASSAADACQMLSEVAARPAAVASEPLLTRQTARSNWKLFERSAEPSQDWRARLGARVAWAKKRYCTQKRVDFWPLATVPGGGYVGIGVLT